MSAEDDSKEIGLFTTQTLVPERKMLSHIVPVLPPRHEPDDSSFISHFFRHISIFLHLFYQFGTLSFRSLPAQFVVCSQIQFFKFFF
jgi:hypothetical protein